MSKELEYIQRNIDIVKQQVKCSKMKIIVTDAVTKHQYDYYENELQTLESIEQALLELQSIKETNPSEALECLERIGVEKLARGELIRNDDKVEPYLNTIKQALIKAQEPKQYVDELKLVEKERKALEIIKELLGKHCKIELVNGGTYYQIKIKIMGSGYSFGMSITEEEFVTLKEVLE